MENANNAQYREHASKFLLFSLYAELHVATTLKKFTLFLFILFLHFNSRTTTTITTKNRYTLVSRYSNSSLFKKKKSRFHSRWFLVSNAFVVGFFFLFILCIRSIICVLYTYNSSSPPPHTAIT